MAFFTHHWRPERLDDERELPLLAREEPDARSWGCCRLPDPKLLLPPYP